MTDQTNPSDFNNIRETGHSQIKGWGIDANPENDPTYPIKKRTDEEQKGYTWERPSQQPEHIEILKSVERPNLTAVFGTSVPPSGLSGKIRRFAFKYSESSYGHWLPLMLADRIGMIEGILDDIRHGHFPNLFKERGLKADLKYNRMGFIRKVAIAGILSAAIITVIAPKKKKKKFRLL